MWTLPRKEVLYELAGEYRDKLIYKRISTLGNGKTSLMEYDPNCPEVVSVIPENRPEVTVEQFVASLPEGEDKRIIKNVLYKSF